MKFFFLFLVLGLGGVLTRGELVAQPEPEGIIRAVRLQGAVNPMAASFIAEELERANAQGERAFLLEIDTPGGLDTAMRDIIQSILSSRIPVIVYVYPPGARAASAGALIALAADFAAMAPGTNIGAAHPVSLGGGGGSGEEGGDSVMMQKVLQDAVAYARSIAERRGRNADWAESIVRESVSTPARQALELGVIDLVAEDEEELLEELDGRTYLRGGEQYVLQSKEAELVFSEMNWRQQILNTISNPNVAYMLLILGALGIFLEISQPGLIFPGAIGAISLLLAFFGLQTLPVNYAGVLLIFLAIILFILEVNIASYGLLSIGGIVAMTLGSLMLIDSSEPYLQVSRAIIAATVAFSTAFFLLVAFFVIRTQKSRFFSGPEGMVGEIGQTVTSVHQEGKIFVHGEYWDAWSRDPLEAGEAVEVVKIEKDLRMEVRRAPKRQ